MNTLQYTARILGLSMYALSFLFPRNRRKWLFGTCTQIFNDNPKYLFIYVNQHCRDIKPIWITSRKNTFIHLKKLRFRVYMKYSIQGIFHGLTAGAYFFSAYAADINFYTCGRAVLINMWHGVGLKKIEFNLNRRIESEKHLKKRIWYRFIEPWQYKRPSYFISSTDFQSVPFSDAFRIPLNKCWNTGYPRNDVLLMPDHERRKFIRRYEPAETIRCLDYLANFQRVYIYMPTWRSAKKNLLHDTKIIDLPLLNQILLASESILVLKLHLNATKEASGSFSNIMELPPSVDVYTLLPYTDVLITDYSSVLYDYLLLDNKKVALYVFDLDEYTRETDFNYPFTENVAGKIIRTAEEFYRIFTPAADLESVHDMNLIKDKFWGNYRGRATEEIFKRAVSALDLQNKKPNGSC